MVAEYETLPTVPKYWVKAIPFKGVSILLNWKYLPIVLFSKLSPILLL